MNEAIARAEKIVAQFPENELARFSLGKAWFDAGDFPRALEQFAPALARKPDWMVVHILTGKCHLSLGDKNAARQSFVRARQLAIDQHHEGPLAEMDTLLQDLEP